MNIQNKKRLFKQSTFGPSEKAVDDIHLCDTPMCTAGNLVNLAGEQGWEFQKKYGFSVAASLIHQKSCRDLPEQNYQSIPDKWALAYLEEMAERESKK